MRARLYNPALFVVRFAILGTLFAALASVLVVAQEQPTQPAPALTKPERFWLAGRYDGDRVIVYFDAVKFEGTLPPSAHRLAPAIAERFFDPVRLPETYIVRFQKGPNAEHFSIGDKYDLLLDYGMVATVTLTTLVGAETDEEVGNDSFIGALATLDREDVPRLRKTHYALRRHRELPAGKLEPASNRNAASSGLEGEPASFDVQTQAVALLTERMKALATDSERRLVQGAPPTFDMHSFHTFDGALRYYARAEWKSGEGENVKSVYTLGAWMALLPALHILAVQTRTSPYDGLGSVLPDLLNVVDLGGRTGLIVGISIEDGGELELVEYHDGQDLSQMHILQSIGHGE
jgi:hypothetical protein